MTHIFQNNTISLNGPFTFSDYQFINSIQSDKSITIDFAHCSYMDSSAIGMLIILHEKFSISIINKPPIIEKIMNIAQLDKIFNHF